MGARASVTSRAMAAELASAVAFVPAVTDKVVTVLSVSGGVWLAAVAAKTPCTAPRTKAEAPPTTNALAPPMARPTAPQAPLALTVTARQWAN